MSQLLLGASEDIAFEGNLHLRQGNDNLRHEFNSLCDNLSQSENNHEELTSQLTQLELANARANSRQHSDNIQRELTKEKKTQEKIPLTEVKVSHLETNPQEKSSDNERHIEEWNRDSKVPERKFQDKSKRLNKKIRELMTNFQMQSTDYENQTYVLRYTEQKSEDERKVHDTEIGQTASVIEEQSTDYENQTYDLRYTEQKSEYERKVHDTEIGQTASVIEEYQLRYTEQKSEDGRKLQDTEKWQMAAAIEENKRGDRTQPCRATCRTVEQTNQGTEIKTPRELTPAALPYGMVSGTQCYTSTRNCCLQKKFGVFVLIFLGFVVGSSDVPTHICPKGTHLFKDMYGWEMCPLCQDGVTYMTDHWHRNLECLNCTRLINPEVELLVTDCNITHDTVINCRSGFYRRLARNPRDSDRCVKCSECAEGNPTRLCEGFYDTVCCGLPNYEAVLNHHNVYICKEKPIACTQGWSYSPYNEQCFPCPPDTYMSEDSHYNKECKPCQKVGNNSSRLLLQACNSTHPAIFDCKPGYFRHSPQESPLSDDDCSPCQTCPFVGRECTSDHDTVCCDTPDMTVIDSNTGPVCVLLSDSDSDTNGGNSSSNQKGLAGKSGTSENIQVCGLNEFIDSINDTLTCQRCREGTYNDVLNHNRTYCQDCSKFSGGQLPANCHTGNGIFQNTDMMGMSIVIIACVVSVSFAVLVIVAYLILRQCKCLYKQWRAKYMYLLQMRLSFVVNVHMGFSWIICIFVTNTTVKIIIIVILTIILFLVACFLLFKFWNQTKSNKAKSVTNNASTESTQALAPSLAQV